MSDPVPRIDPRSAADLRSELLVRLQANVPGWSASDPATGQPDPVSAALIGVAARFGELVIERLNQVPGKNFLAFLDLLGVAPNPPQPARVPLTFVLAPVSTADAVVPAGTQVAAAAAEGEKDPVVFETERELTVVAATLQSLVAVDARRDGLADHAALLAAPGTAEVPLFGGPGVDERRVYFGFDTELATRALSRLTLGLAMAPQPPAAQREIQRQDLAWEVWDGAAWRAVAPQDSGPASPLEGDVVFESLPAMPVLALQGLARSWLRARLLKPVSPEAAPALGMLRAGLLPLLDTARIRVAALRAALQPEAAFLNTVAVDTSRPFLPFGDQPRLGDAFHIGSAEAFGLPGATVTLSLGVLNPAAQATTPVQASADLRLRWEAWTGQGWALLGESTPASPGSGSFSDATRAFTTGPAATVQLVLPDTLARRRLNGVDSFWIRVLIAAGNYGVEARYVPAAGGGFTLQPASFAPPVLQPPALACEARTADLPAAVLGQGAFDFEDLGAHRAEGQPVPMFGAPPLLEPALYAGFTLPAGRSAFPNRAVALYGSVSSPAYGTRRVPLHPDRSVQTADGAAPSTTHRFTVSNPGPDTQTAALGSFGGSWPRTVIPAELTLAPGATAEVSVIVTPPAGTPADAADRGFLQLRFAGDALAHSVLFETRMPGAPVPQRRLRAEYWNGSAWSRLALIDGTEHLARSGLIEFIGPADFAPSRLFGQRRHWLRLLLEPGDAALLPQLRALLPNTGFATQSLTLRNELLGSSDASAGQVFQTTRSPVLAAPRLEVREPGPLPADERAALVAAHGDDDVTSAVDGRPQELWVRWIEMPDLHGSGPLDRHYLLDHASGRVSFGDGVQGRLPPRASGGIRMARYHTGGGERGNRAAGSVVQLKTTVPYVARAFNVEAAAGGFGAEPDAALVERAPRLLRHGGRAVAADDYEDLARLATPEVARARCVPLRRLQDDPLGDVPVSGAVSVIVVPGSTETRPSPSLDLLARTQAYLQARGAAGADIGVVGPLYVRVDVTLEVMLAGVEGASRIEQAIRTQLETFLHPLTGGRDGQGWDFGRVPHASDIHALVNGIAGVDHVRSLALSQQEELPGTLASGRFLVHSGHHQIGLAFAGREPTWR